VVAVDHKKSCTASGCQRAKAGTRVGPKAQHMIEPLFYYTPQHTTNQSCIIWGRINNTRSMAISIFWIYQTGHQNNQNIDPTYLFCEDNSLL